MIIEVCTGIAVVGTDVIISREAISSELSGEQIRNGVVKGHEIISDWIYMDVHNGRIKNKPFGFYLRYDEWIHVRSDIMRSRAEEFARSALKIVHSASRRSQFNGKRSQLILQMLDAGIESRCAIDGCRNSDLTVDHKIPLSRGGGDEISNLQFLCASHNSEKGSRI